MASANGGRRRSETMPQPEFTDEKYFQIYQSTWQNIAREDSNIANRVGWAIGLSTGLFGSIAFMAPRINDYCSGVFWPPVICAVICTMAGLGLFFSYRTKLGVEAAHRQIGYLREHYAHYVDRLKALGLPRPFGDSHQGQGLKSSAIYPNALIFFWSAILLASFVGTAWTFAMAFTDPHPAACKGRSTQPFAAETAPPTANQ